jgi:hypothetical protein
VQPQEGEFFGFLTGWFRPISSLFCPFDNCFTSSYHFGAGWLGLAGWLAMVLVDADWWLYLVLVIAIFVLLAVNVYVLVLWQHPDDKNEAYWPKFVVLLGLTVAEGSVLFLPLDVANNSGSIECGQSWSDIFCGSLNMEVGTDPTRPDLTNPLVLRRASAFQVAWDVIFIMMFVLALFVIPYTIFFYGRYARASCTQPCAVRSGLTTGSLSLCQRRTTLQFCRGRSTSGAPVCAHLPTC